MNPHKSVEQYTNDSSMQDIVFEDFEQISNGCWRTEEMDKLGLKMDDYPINRSLLFRAHASVLKYNKGKPTAFLNHTIVFAVGINPANNLPIVPSGNVVVYDHDACKYFEKFFIEGWLPKISTNKKHYTNQLCAVGVPCIYCHGTAQNTYQVMHESIRFGDIPRESLLYIEKEEIPIDYNDTDSLDSIAYLMKVDKDKISEYDSQMDECKKRIIEYVENEMAKLLSARSNMQKILDAAGCDFPSFTTELAKIEAKLELAEEKDYLAELEQDRAELDEKRAKLDKQIDETTARITELSQ